MAARPLSADAAPVVAGGLRRLEMTPLDACVLRSGLRDDLRTRRDWRGWNLGRSRAAAVARRTPQAPAVPGCYVRPAEGPHPAA